MSLIQWIACACVGLVFANAGIGHFAHFRHLAAMLEQRRWPLPRVLLGAGSALQIVAGLGLLYPPVRAASAMFLIVFTVWASVGLLDFWTRTGSERVMMRNAFSANIAIIGGLLLIATSR